MTKEEFYSLYNKIDDTLYEFYVLDGYHCWYYCCNEIYNGTSMSFEVHIHDNRGEGYDKVEDWVIDDHGRIHTEGDIYENYDEFLKEWI